MWTSAKVKYGYLIPPRMRGEALSERVKTVRYSALISEVPHYFPQQVRGGEVEEGGYSMSMELGVRHLQQ